MAAEPVEINGEAVLFTKIAQVMGEVGRVEKRGWNDFNKYHYVTEVDLVEAVRAKLAERNVALIPSVTAVDERPYTTSKGKESVVTTASLAFTFVDGDTGATFRAEWAGQGDDPADKGLYSAYTGAVKYFLMKTFLIPTGDDPEANAATDARAADRAPSAPQIKDPGAPATEGQRKFLNTLLKRAQIKKVDDANRVLSLFTGREIKAGTSELSKGEAADIIERLKNGEVPSVQHPSDVPGAADGEFVHPSEEQSIQQVIETFDATEEPAA